MSRSRSRSSMSGSTVDDTIGGTTNDEQFYESEPPTILTDSLLHPPSTNLKKHKRPGQPRTNSWSSILTAQSDPEDSDLDTSPHSDPSTATPEDRTRSSNRSERSRSKSRQRSLPGYKRPSPLWLLPGTFLIAMSMGMTYAPKLEIYTQLICRAIDPEKSGVTIPPPISSSPNRPSLFVSLTSPDKDTYLDRHATYGVETEWKGDVGTEMANRDKEWANQCHRSSAVQSQVARLALILTLMMGILSSLTTGWWGSFSDRKGRKPVLILALFGTVAMDVVFLVTVNYHHLVSYNFLLLGPILDGLVGGFSTAQATTSAYLSDCTSPGSRARIFSLLGGLMFAGFSTGPFISSMILSYSAAHSPSHLANVLLPFYIALAAHLIYLLGLIVALPESLSATRRIAAQERHDLERTVRHEREEKILREVFEGGEEGGRGGEAGKNLRILRWRIRNLFEKVFSFLKPLAMLLPAERVKGVKHQKQRNEEGTDDDDGGEEAAVEVDEDLRTNIDWGSDLKQYWHPEDVWKATESGDVTSGGQQSKRDWSLTKIAIGYSSYMMIMAIITVKLQYANYTFDWSAREDGLFLSFIGVLRVVALLVFLPLFVKLLRRPPPEPTRARPDGQEEGKKWDKEKKWLKVVTDSHFDLRLAVLSLGLDVTGFLLFAIASLANNPTPTPFLLATFIQSLGSGTSPTLQSLALAHSTPRDSGRLFASLSVVQSLSSQVIGPIVFGTTFINTVGKGKWTGSVFWLAGGLCLISFTCISSLRLRRVWIDEKGNVDDAGERDESIDRGRSSKVTPTTA